MRLEVPVASLWMVEIATLGESKMCARFRIGLEVGVKDALKQFTLDKDFGHSQG